MNLMSCSRVSTNEFDLLIANKLRYPKIRNNSELIFSYGIQSKVLSYFAKFINYFTRMKPCFFLSFANGYPLEFINTSFFVSQSNSFSLLSVQIILYTENGGGIRRIHFLHLITHPLFLSCIIMRFLISTYIISPGKHVSKFPYLTYSFHIY